MVPVSHPGAQAALLHCEEYNEQLTYVEQIVLDAERIRLSNASTIDIVPLSHLTRKG